MQEERKKHLSYHVLLLFRPSTEKKIARTTTYICSTVKEIPPSTQLASFFSEKTEERGSYTAYPKARLSIGGQHFSQHE